MTLSTALAHNPYSPQLLVCPVGVQPWQLPGPHASLACVIVPLLIRHAALARHSIPLRTTYIHAGYGSAARVVVWC
eukprot:9436287-Alexandrium_andersonii.AAC.1